MNRSRLGGLDAQLTRRLGTPAIFFRLKNNAPSWSNFNRRKIMKSNLIAIALIPAFALAACGQDSAVEETGDALEERADAVEDYGDDRAAALEERADEMPTDAGEDALNQRAERIDDIGDERADAINEVADEME
jgi:hypothetical protein